MTEQYASEQAPQKDLGSKIHETDSHEVIETNVSSKLADISTRSFKKEAAEKPKLQTLGDDDTSVQDKETFSEVKVSEKQHIIPDREFPVPEEVPQKTLSTKMRRQRFAKTKEASDKKTPSESIAVEDETEAETLRKGSKPKTVQRFIDQKSPHPAEECTKTQTVTELHQVTISTVKDKTPEVSSLKESKCVQEEEKVKEESLEEVELLAVDEQTSQVDGDLKDSRSSKEKRQKLMKTKDAVDNQLPRKTVSTKEGLPIKDKMPDIGEQNKVASKQPTELTGDQEINEGDFPPKEENLIKFAKATDVLQKEVPSKPVKNKKTAKCNEQKEQPASGSIIVLDQINISKVTDKMLKVSPLKEKIATQEQAEIKVSQINTEETIEKTEKMQEGRKSEFLLIEEVKDFSGVSPEKSVFSNLESSADNLQKEIPSEPVKTKKTRKGDEQQTAEEMLTTETMSKPQGLIVEQEQINISTVTDKMLKVSLLKEKQATQELMERKVSQINTEEKETEKLPEMRLSEFSVIEEVKEADVSPEESVLSKFAKSTDALDRYIPLKPAVAVDKTIKLTVSEDKTTVGDEETPKPPNIKETESASGETKDLGAPKIFISSDNKTQKFPQTIDISDEDFSLVMDKSRKNIKDDLLDKDKEQVHQPTDDDMLPKMRIDKFQGSTIEQDQITTSVVKDRTLKVSPEQSTSEIMTEDKQILSKTICCLDKANLTSVNDRTDKPLPRATKQERPAENLSEIQEGGFATGEAEGFPKEIKEMDPAVEATDQNIQPKLVRDKHKTKTDRRGKSRKQQFKVKVLDEADVPANIEETSVRKEVQVDLKVAEGSTLTEEALKTKKLRNADEFQSSLKAQDTEDQASRIEENVSKQEPSKKPKPVSSQLEKHKTFAVKGVHATEEIADESEGFQSTREELEKVQRKITEVPVGQEDAEIQQRPEDKIRDLKIFNKPEKTEVLGNISIEKQLRDAENAEDVTEMDKTTTIHPAEEMKNSNTETEAARKGQKTEKSCQISQEATEEEKLDQTEITQDVTRKKSKSLKEKDTKFQDKEWKATVFKQEYGRFTPAEEAETPKPLMKVSVAPVMEVAFETSGIAIDDNEPLSLKKSKQIKVEDAADKLPTRVEEDKLKSQVRSEPEAKEVPLEKVNVLDKPASFLPKRVNQTETKDGELSGMVRVKQEYGEISQLFPETKQQQKAVAAATLMEIPSEKHLITDVGDFKSDHLHRSTAPDNLETSVETVTEKMFDLVSPEVIEKKVKNLTTDKASEDKTQQRVKRREKSPIESFTSKTETVRDYFHDISQTAVMEQQEAEQKVSKTPVMDVAYEKSMHARAQDMLDIQTYISPDSQVKDVRPGEIVYTSGDVSVLIERTTKDRIHALDQPEEIEVNIRKTGKLETGRKSFIETETLQSQDESDKPISPEDLSSQITAYRGDKSETTIQAKTVPAKEKLATISGGKKVSLTSTPEVMFKESDTTEGRRKYLKDSKTSEQPIEPNMSAGVRKDKQAERELTQGRPIFEPSVTDKPKVSTTGHPSEHTRTTTHIHSVLPKTHETRTETERQGMQSVTETKGLTAEPEEKENLFLQETSRGTEEGNYH
ncbi:A-kinase anchor protein 12-like [Gambusia affinis]|uniref:A-kinase anchor protein 12-like n=1 Tax=Gambusia affinis TaxID=33528 RepID=UPI001CDC107F|nr:A-kinase anchor protein 12-like [Gambusia affinis]